MYECIVANEWMGGVQCGGGAPPPEKKATPTRSNRSSCARSCRQDSGAARGARRGDTEGGSSSAGAPSSGCASSLRWPCCLACVGGCGGSACVRAGQDRPFFGLRAFGQGSPAAAGCWHAHEKRPSLPAPAYPRRAQRTSRMDGTRHECGLWLPPSTPALPPPTKRSAQIGAAPTGSTMSTRKPSSGSTAPSPSPIITFCRRRRQIGGGGAGGLSRTFRPPHRSGWHGRVLTRG